MNKIKTRIPINAARAVFVDGDSCPFLEPVLALASYEDGSGEHWIAPIILENGRPTLLIESEHPEFVGILLPDEQLLPDWESRIEATRRIVKAKTRQMTLRSVT